MEEPTPQWGWCRRCRVQPRASRSASYCKACDRQRYRERQLIPEVRAANTRRSREASARRRAKLTAKEREAVNLAARQRHAERMTSDPAYAERIRLLTNQRRAAGRIAGRRAADYYRRNYGIELAEWDAMWLAQGGACAICRTPETEVGDNRRLAVDHDHETGHIRGLLCTGCNQALGRFKDSIEVLQAAIAYLEQGRRMNIVDP